MNSIERRLQLGLALMFVLLTIIFWALVNRSMHSLVEDFVISRLVDDAQNMITALSADRKHTRVRWRRINDIYNKVNSGHYYVFKFSDGRVINSPSLWDKTLAVPHVAKGTETRYQTDAPTGHRVQVWAKHYTKDGHDFTLAVAEDLGLIKAHRQRFKRNFALSMLIGFFSLLILQTLLIRNSFSRFDKVRQDVRLLEQGKREKLTQNVPNEIKPLVAEFNHLLQLLMQRLTRSRNSLGNLAHALKGPLNLLMQSLDNTDELDRQQAHNQATRIGQLIDRELRRARLAGKGVTTHHFEAQNELPNLVKVLKQVHRGKDLLIDCTIPATLPSFGDREDMLELIGNILDNACKWAKSKVICRFKVNKNFNITIEDDGDGLSEALIEQLAQRGMRLDESIEGTGLGLAIARDIVSLYGGTISFHRSDELGGLLIAIRLPLKKT